jgi:hypothetical protein
MGGAGWRAKPPGYGRVPDMPAGVWRRPGPLSGPPRRLVPRQQHPAKHHGGVRAPEARGSLARTGSRAQVIPAVSCQPQRFDGQLSPRLYQAKQVTAYHCHTFVLLLLLDSLQPILTQNSLSAWLRV